MDKKLILSLFSKIRRHGGGSPHKPILLLEALDNIKKGRERLISFKNYVDKVEDKINRATGWRSSKTTNYPFCRLVQDDLWELQGNEGLSFREKRLEYNYGDLIQNNVKGGFKDAIYKFLNKNKSVIEDIKKILISMIEDQKMEDKKPTETFIQKVRKDITTITEEFSTVSSECDAFPCWLLSKIHDIDTDEALNQCDTLSQGDLGLDGYFFDEQSETLYLYQTKYPDHESDKQNDKAINEIYEAFQQLQDDEMVKDRPKLRDVSILLKDTINAGNNVELVAAVFSSFTESAEERRHNIQKTINEDKKYENVRVSLLDINKLYEKDLTENELTGLESKEINIKLFDDGFIELPEDSLAASTTKSALCNLDAVDLARVISANTPMIFSKNVRFHLGKVNKVNKSMRELIESSDYKNFWSFNNGITIVADDFNKITDEEDENSGAVKFINPQIVNGCQTSTALKDSLIQLEQHESTFPIACKITAVEDTEEGSKFLIKISDKSNSQSAVKITDLKSNHQHLVQLQADFARLDPPWFYIRKRGEWSTLGRAEKGRYDKRRIEAGKVAQRWRAYSGEPAQCITNKEEIYSDQNLFNKYFNPNDVTPNKLLLAHNIWEEISNLLGNTETIIDKRKKLVGEEFDNILLPYVERAKALWVAHILASFAKLLEKSEGTISTQRARDMDAEIKSNPDSLDHVWKVILGGYKIWHESMLTNPEFDLHKTLKNNSTFGKVYSSVETVARLLPDLPSFPRKSSG